ncbi:phosphoglycerate mutase-like protein [Hypomontagnella monticulosa]|nr:phosphoglycerate mutase-like protein [Hypomontagnella monticulosa]
MASLSLRALAAALFLVNEAVAQSANETVWASFAYVLYGERTPLQGQLVPSLTPLGAQQLYSQGSLFRARYLSSSNLSDEDNAITTNSPINGIERQALDNSQIAIYSSTDGFVVGGALAFLQGLYPPVTQEFAFNNGGNNASILANGTMVNYPLGGYQYPNILTVPPTDPNSVWFEGHVACAEYWSSGNDFKNSATYQETYDATLNFYEQTWADVFPNTLANSMLNFDYAYDLYDYAQYEYDHDASVRDALNVNRLAILRNFADTQQFDLNGNLSASGAQEGDMIRAISGRMLAAKIVSQLSAHISSGGSANKMTLMFGSYEPFLAFFALSDIANTASSRMFRRIPNPGAAMVFEVFTTDDDARYPTKENAWVRFLYRNGTDADSPMTEYPLFGRGNSEARMRWSDFQTEMAKFSVQDVSTWCDMCGSVTLFCAALSHSSDNSPSLSGSGESGNPNASLSPAVAGVIGAVIALAVLGLAAVTAFVFGGVRIRRKGPSEAIRRQSSLGGFKGAEKMASDHDVSIAKTGVRHERVGSWELGGPGPAVTMPAPAVTPQSSLGSTFGATIVRDRHEDEDSIMNVSPVSPTERV